MPARDGFVDELRRRGRLIPIKLPVPLDFFGGSRPVRAAWHELLLPPAQRSSTAPLLPVYVK